MALYKVLDGFCFAPGKDVYPGDVVELDEQGVKDHSFNIKVGRLVLAADAKPEVGAEQPVASDAGAPATQDPTPRRR